MLEALIQKLAVCGLQLIELGDFFLTTFSFPLETSDFVDVYGVMVQDVHAESMQKMGPELTRQSSIQERFGTSPSFAGCLAQI